MKSVFKFWFAMISTSLKGSKSYYLWLGFLSIWMILGGIHYYDQFTQGLVVTNLVDEVSWGAYIANFTFLVGVAAAAVLLVFPAYVMGDHDIHEVVLVGEILAFSAVVLCLLFIMVDLGSPLNFLHIIPGIGRLNFPESVLAWDVLVINGYLLLNLHIPFYTLYCLYMGKKPQKKYYLPFVFISIFWAISLHTVTAFLYSGLGGRPFWNSAVLAPRFLVSAFAGGPLILMFVFYLIDKNWKHFPVKKHVFDYLIKVARVMLPLNSFLLFCEVFKEFYTDSAHVASAQYLFTGLNGFHMLTPYIWGALIFELFTMIVIFRDSSRKKPVLFLSACILGFIGIWVEKGMGLIIPGFVPSSLGSIIEYIPSTHEFFICLGIWSFGALLFTMMAKAATSIMSGKVLYKSE